MYIIPTYIYIYTVIYTHKYGLYNCTRNFSWKKMLIKEFLPRGSNLGTPIHSQVTMTRREAPQVRQNPNHGRFDRFLDVLSMVCHCLIVLVWDRYFPWNHGCREMVSLFSISPVNHYHLIWLWNRICDVKTFVTCHMHLCFQHLFSVICSPAKMSKISNHIITPTTLNVISQYVDLPGTGAFTYG